MLLRLLAGANLGCDITPTGEDGIYRTEGRDLHLAEHLAILRARRWSVVLVFVIVVGVMIAASYRQTPVYTADARVLVEPLPTGESAPIAPPNLKTEREVVASVPVAMRVIEDLGLDASPGGVLRQLDVEAVLETEVLVVTFTSRRPAQARDAANSFAQHYIEYRRERALEKLASVEASYRTRIAAVGRRLSEVSGQLEAARGEGDESLVTTLETERSVLIARLGSLQQRLDEVQPDRSSTLAESEIIEPATLPGSPSSPKHLRDAALGVGLGLVMGVGAAFVRERLDQRLRGQTDVAEAVEAPVLTTVPRFGPRRRRRAPPLIAAQAGPPSEAYRTLRTNIEFVMARDGTRSFLITSPAAGEGKTATTANLGLSVAQAGFKVALVSADLRRPSLESYFGVDNRMGLSTWLAGQFRNPWLLLGQTSISELRVLPSGPIPPNPAELLTSQRLRLLVAELEKQFDLVLFDSPPMLAVADGAILASRVGSTILVVDAARTSRSAVVHARGELAKLGLGLAGIVLNRFQPSRSPYAYYYHYPSYGYRRSGAGQTQTRPQSPNGAQEQLLDNRLVPGKRSMPGG